MINRICFQLNFVLLLFIFEKISDRIFSYDFISPLIYHTINHNHKNIIHAIIGKNNLNQTNIDTNIKRAHNHIQNFKNIHDIPSLSNLISLAIHDHNANIHKINHNHSINNIHIFINSKNIFCNFSFIIDICTTLNRNSHPNKDHINFLNENFLLKMMYDTGMAEEIIAPIINHRFLPNNHQPHANISL